MNKTRRGQIEKVITGLNALIGNFQMEDEINNIQEDIDSIYNDENETKENMPESLQMTERYANIENAAAALEEAVDLISELLSKVTETSDAFSEIISKLEEARDC